ncbi:hypothetical protein QVD17_34122 [Tagetes erecta]|uniref:RIN4 pathogenic type III effector avirulence factor Avr cleavage site domain-containing protein n=1 Tax=Tagetes erecta TaxID=13708 RepID=A0AAD8NLG3_TARER|nr:hypothetical protein QVD17_34122 [Tagetes erecta]
MTLAFKRPLHRFNPNITKVNKSPFNLHPHLFTQQHIRSTMDYDYDYDYDYKRNNVPAFGSWDCNDNLPFTQCFESARQAGLLRYSYSEDRDLYVTGDLYDNNVVTPAMIVVPRRTRKAAGYPNIKEKKDAWVVCDYEYGYNYDCDAKQPPSPVTLAVPPSPPPPEQQRQKVKPKAVDEDLYRISPALLRVKPRRKKWGLFSSCMQPTCVM